MNQPSLDSSNSAGSMVNPAQDRDGKYYIYASTAGKSSDQGASVLKKATPADKFVGSLNKEQAIALVTKPDPTAQFDRSDKTRQWFSNLDGDVSISLTLNVNDAEEIKCFAVQFKTPWPLTFSSDAEVLLLTFGALPTTPTGARIPPPGVDADGRVLTCGLDFGKTTSVSCTVDDLVKHAYGGDMTDAVPARIREMKATLAAPAREGPKRDALWFVPSLEMQTTVRLQFQLGDLKPMREFLRDALRGLSLDSANAIYTKRTVLAATEHGSQPLHEGGVVFSVRCSLADEGEAGANAVSMTAGVEFAPSGISLTVLFNTPDALEKILHWLGQLIDDKTTTGFASEMLSKIEDGTPVFPNIHIRRLRIELDYPPNGNRIALAAFTIDVEVAAAFGRTSAQDGVPVFLVSYGWSRFSGGFGTLGGHFWNHFDVTRDQDLMPNGEAWNVLRPVTSNPATSIDIASLIPTQKVVHIPDVLPSKITRAYVVLSKGGLAVGGTLAAKPVSPESVPLPTLGEVALDATFQWGASRDFALDVSFRVDLMPTETCADQTPAVFQGALSYRSQKWTLKGSITGLYASSLAAFFDPQLQHHAGSLLGSIAINTLQVEYKYEPAAQGADQDRSAGSEFSIQGKLLVAGLELGLSFKTNKRTFDFDASVGLKDKTATLGSVLTDMLGHPPDLPDFVTDMNIANGGDTLRLEMKKEKVKEATAKTGQGDAEASLLFWAQFKFDKLSLDFVQLQGRDRGANVAPKRLIKCDIKGLSGQCVDIPLVGKIQQPLDEMYFLWVQDRSQDKGGVLGLTRQDVDQVNGSLAADGIVVEDKFKDKKPTDLLVGAGCHFAVVVRDEQGNRSCILDYGFLKPKPASSAGLLAEGTGDDEADSAQAPYKKKTGPLSISNVGLKYQGKRLAIMLDATFDMGPLGFSLLGLSVGARFRTLDAVPDLDVEMQGLAVAFSKPPLTMAGIIRHVKSDTIEYYAGGLIIGFEPWQFEAAGFYGTVQPSKAAAFTSVFIFAKLEGPLVTLEFAELAGVTGGFGYNSEVRVPTADQIRDFPFIACSGLDGQAQDVLKKLTDPGRGGWFRPLDKTYWAAVGLKVDALRMLSVDAVLVVQFGDALRLGLFAMAVADIPEADSPVKFSHVELGIAAVADLGRGTLKIEAQLTPRSFILHPDCHLTGGAGLYYWFDAPLADASRTGSFVFTLGGYHRAFDAPADYPKPPRLGISWSLTEHLSITGQAYFAMTPNACMGGGRLHAAFRAGPIDAWFDVFADFLINYRPFHFLAEASLSVGVRFSNDIAFIHTHTSCEIGARIYLWGPPLAGRVHVDFWVYAFNIDFGSRSQARGALTLDEFYHVVLQTSSQTRPSLLSGEKPAAEAVSSPPKKNEGHVFMATSGLMNPGGDKTKRLPHDRWTVRASTFAFTIRCKMAINQVKLGSIDAKPIITYGNADSHIDVYSRAMHLEQPMQSTLVVTTTQDGVAKPDAGWRFHAHVMSVPKGLWAKYDQKADPLASRAGNNLIKQLLNGSDTSMPLMMGVDVLPPKPVVSPDRLPSFTAADAQLQILPADKPFPGVQPSSSAWEPEKPHDIKTQYREVQDQWVRPVWGANAQKAFVDAFAAAMGWHASGLSSHAGMPPGLQQSFTDLYVAPPLMTAAA